MWRVWKVWRGLKLGCSSKRTKINIFDRIELSKSEFANFAAVQNNMPQVGANTVITHDANDTITLLGVHPTNLHASEFVFV